MLKGARGAICQGKALPYGALPRTVLVPTIVRAGEDGDDAGVVADAQTVRFLLVGAARVACGGCESECAWKSNCEMCFEWGFSVSKGTDLMAAPHMKIRGTLFVARLEGGRWYHLRRGLEPAQTPHPPTPHPLSI